MTRKRIQPTKRQAAAVVKNKNKPPTRKRGRPPSEATLELRRIEQMLASAPPTLRMTAQEQAEFDAQMKDSEKTRQTILKMFKHGATTPNKHAYEMASIGDESLEGYEDQILKRDEEFKRRAQNYRAKSSAERAEVRRHDAERICRHFGVLVDQISPRGPLSVHAAAEKMHANWPDALSENSPSVRTLQDYIRIGSPYPEHRVGRVSLGKK